MRQPRASAGLSALERLDSEYTERTGDLCLRCFLTTENAENRSQVRQQRPVPLLAELRQKPLGQKEQLLPKRPLAEAVDYTLGQWIERIAFCPEGAVPIEHGLSERG